MSTPDQPDQTPQQPGGPPAGPPASGAPPPGAPPPPPPAPQYGAPQAPQYGAPQAGAPSYAAPGQDPGKTMGIVGLVLSFLGCLSIVGLILSIVAFNKSKKAGYKNGLALAGIIVGAIVLVLTIIGSIVFFSTVGAVTQEVLDACSGVPSGTVVEVRGEPVTCP